MIDENIASNMSSYIDKLLILIEKVEDDIYVLPEKFLESSFEIINSIIEFMGIVVKTSLKYNENINIDNMNEAMKFLLESLNNKDYILVLDIYEYEIARILKIWKKEILFNIK